MGVIHTDLHDAFFSYARDDDSYNDHWVHHFHEELKRKYGELLRKSIAEYPILKGITEREVDFFIDKEGLPVNGDLTAELKGAIGKSQFLFIFVGTKYPESDWCGKEVTYFEEHLKSQGLTPPGIYNRLFIIVFESRALKLYWRNRMLEEAKERAIYQTFYDEDGYPIPPRLPDENKTLQTNPRISYPLRRLAETMVKRTVEITHPAKVAEAPPEPSQTIRGVTIGVVGPNLEDATQKLKKQFEARDIPVETLALADLESRESEAEVQKKLLNSTIFVQPFDYGRVLLHTTQEGGHLKVQENLIRMINDRLRIFWWLVPRELGGIQSGDENAETWQSHAAYLARMDENARKGGVDEIAACVVGRARTLPTVYIESGIDEDISNLLAEKLQEMWDSEFGNGNVTLLCMPVPWDALRKASKDSFEKCQGIIFVFGRKTWDSLRDQIQVFETRLWAVGIKRTKLGRAVALVTPEQTQSAGYPLNFRCTKTDDQLTVEEEKVRRFLRQIYQEFSKQLAPADD